MFELAYACGLRAEELVSLRVADVDHDGEQLRVEGKGRKTRFVPVGEPAMAALRVYLERARRSPRRAERRATPTAPSAVPLEDRPAAGHERRAAAAAHVDRARGAELGRAGWRASRRTR